MNKDVYITSCAK